MAHARTPALVDGGAAAPQNTGDPSTRPPKRLYELDLLRFLAASSVLLYHYSFHGYMAGDARLTALPYLSIASVSKYGFLGVNLFFLISGFVILMTAAGGSLWRFAVSRGARLYPAFWICCTITFIASRLIGHNGTTVTFRDYLLNMTMVSGLRGVPSVDGVYWSLLVEIRFYLLVAIVLAAGQIARAKTLLGVWLVLYLAELAWPVRLLSSLVIPEWGPYFIAGAMFYFVWREGISIYKGAVIAVCYMVSAWTAAASVQRDAVFYHTPFSSTIVCLVLAMFFAIFLAISTGQSAALSTRRWLVLGALTYPLYLLHQYLGYWLFNLGYGRLNVHLLFWGVLVAIFALAHGVALVEHVATMMLRRHFLSANTTTPAGPVAVGGSAVPAVGGGAS